MENKLSYVVSVAKNGLKTLNKYACVHVVLGNETCDLDSAVSSLVYSLYIHNGLKSTEKIIVLPVFNVPREQLAIKTEVIYLLTKYGFNMQDFICRDEIDLKTLQNRVCLHLTLVDHHVLDDNDLDSSLTDVIDHRPLDSRSPWCYGVDTYPRFHSCSVHVTILRVGSCCSIIAEKILTRAPQLVSPMIATWLLGTILLDTACLSPLVGKAKPEDVRAAEQLQALCPQPLDKEKLYNELKTAKTDISSLTSAQLLVKDLKIAFDIPIAGLPMKVKDFLERDDAIRSIQTFCEEKNVCICILYGQREIQGVLTKDIAVFDHSDSEVASKVASALMNCKEPHLSLRPVSWSLQELRLFEQDNIKASRKDVLPVIGEVANNISMKI